MKKTLLILMIGMFLFSMSFVLAQPPELPHQFYGQILDFNETGVTGNVSVRAMVNGTESSTVSILERYGYDFPFFVEGGSDGDVVEFYVYGIWSGNYTYQTEGVNEFNLDWPCGDGILREDLGEECDGTNFTETCSAGQTGSVTCNNHCKLNYSACVDPAPAGQTGSPGSPGSPSGPSGTVTQRVPDCVEKWVCGSWSACVDGQTNNVCLDENECGTEEDKPETSRTCKEAESESPSQNEFSSPGAGKEIIVVVLIFITLIGVGVILFVYWSKIMFWWRERLYKRRIEKLMKIGEKASGKVVVAGKK